MYVCMYVYIYIYIYIYIYSGGGPIVAREGRAVGAGGALEAQGDGELLEAPLYYFIISLLLYLPFYCILK